MKRKNVFQLILENIAFHKKVRHSKIYQSPYQTFFLTHFRSGISLVYFFNQGKKLGKSRVS